MLQGNYGVTVHLATTVESETALGSNDRLLDELRDYGYTGPPPPTVAEAEELLLKERFGRDPVTTVQRRQLELICLYGGLCLEDVQAQLTDRWEAGCWIKAHLHLAGDWPYFDG
jgi:hypothetical protein